MARKVLISFLGTGPKGNKEIGPQKGNRSYWPATYHFEDDSEIETSFVADALVRHYDIENTILLGTTHSMWERVYETFCDNKSIDIDLNYYVELANYCDNANSKSPLTIPHPKKIEEVLGGDSHVVLLRYGITEEEIQENISIVLCIEKYLMNGDELIVDITHSFRSLPLYIMSLLLYLKNISTKKIAISRICYGMLDVTDEFGYTPIVSLNGIMDVHDWITGAYNFMEFGNTYKIAKLLENDSSGQYDDAAKRLRGFADAKNLNRLREFRKKVKSLTPLMDNRSLPDIGKILIPGIIDKFTKRFPASLNEYTYQFRMAEWHKERHNYGYALINLVESALSFCCALMPDSLIPVDLVRDKKDKMGNILRSVKRETIRKCLNYTREDQGCESIETLRKEFKTLMERQGINFSEFNRQYDNVNYDRNTIAHDLDRDKYKSYSTILQDLKKGIKYFRRIYSIAENY